VDAAEIDCDGTGSNVIAGPLEPDDTFTCVATGTATAGQYENTGTVVGTDTMDAEVTDDDPSHYFGVASAIDIEKATNGDDADEPTGPYVTPGGAVEWTYVVRNTGNVPLTNVTVTDDQVDAASIDCDATGGNVVAGPLAPDDTFTCVATGTATVGQYANLGTVTGIDPLQTEVTDEDASHYFGAVPAIDIEKATNGDDADEAPGPLVPVDGDVEWTYVVTNTGNVPLTNVTVTDDQVDAASIDCDGTGSNVIAGPLEPDDTFSCVATGTATAGQYENTGTVVGTDPTDTDVTDDDPSHYFGVASAVDIEKATNGDDADEAPGPLVPVGGDVEWTYVVTNTGNVPLTNVMVTDDQVGAADIDCDSTGSNVIPGPLEPEASFTCVATGTAIVGQYENLGTVTAFDPLDEEVTDDDPSHYFGAAPAIDIEKATNGEDADEAPGVPLTVGDDVEWTYVVTNTGNVQLTNVTVTDDQVDASEITCGDGGSNVFAGPLAPGESFECTASGVAIDGPYVNTGTVTGVDPLQAVVTDADPAHYTGTATVIPPTESPEPSDPPASTSPASPAGDLPDTGVTPLMGIVGGSIAIIVGFIVVIATRRRKA